MSMLQKALNDAVKSKETPTTPSPQLSHANAIEAICAQFKANDMTAFRATMISHDLTPNIILPNGLTLLQNSLLEHPKDTNRIQTLLALGADPNLYMSQNSAESFGDKAYPKSFNPLNYAFTHHETLNPEIMNLLCLYGASTRDIRNYKESDPSKYTPDSLTKAVLRQTILSTQANPTFIAETRRDIDNSMTQDSLSQAWITLRENAHVIKKAEEVLSQTSEQELTDTQKIFPPMPALVLPDNTRIGDSVTVNGLFMGIYFGKWNYVDYNNLSIRKSYYLFADSHDVKDRTLPLAQKRLLMMYKEAKTYVTNLKNWRGHDGKFYDNDKDLEQALKSNSYRGEWIIPPSSFLNGEDVHKRHVPCLFKNKDAGSLKGTFRPRAFKFSRSKISKDDYSYLYWSCSKYDHNLKQNCIPGFAMNVSMRSGVSASAFTNREKLTLRLCRLEPAP